MKDLTFSGKPRGFAHLSIAGEAGRVGKDLTMLKSGEKHENNTDAIEEIPPRGAACNAFTRLTNKVSAGQVRRS